MKSMFTRPQALDQGRNLVQGISTKTESLTNQSLGTMMKSKLPRMTQIVGASTVIGISGWLGIPWVTKEDKVCPYRELENSLSPT